MTSSRSRASRSSRLALVVACAVLGLIGGLTGLPGPAHAERKRVVVLDLEGPRGGRFHDDLVKLIQKAHTVVPTAKWNSTADDLDASEVSERNLKRVARKLKVDAIIEGKIEKRRDAFIIRLKLREGRSGALVGNSIDTKSGAPRIDGKAQRDLKDELFGAIAGVESNRVSGGEDDEARPSPAARKRGKKLEDDEADRPSTSARKGGKKLDDEDEDGGPRKFSRRLDDERGGDRVERKGKKVEEADTPVARKGKKAEEADAPVARKGKPAEDDDAPARKGKKAEDDDEQPAGASEDRGGKKRVASSDDELTGEADPGAGPSRDRAALGPGERALDAVVGLSVTARRLTFAIRPGLDAPPPSYKGAPVAGGMIDATIYPLAVGHKRKDMLKNLGLSVLYDRVFTVSTKDAMGKVYNSKESRFGIGAVFRYPFGASATSPVVLGSLSYGSQLFSIASGTTLGIPSVKYSIIEPGAGLRYPVTPRIVAGLDARLMLITGTGQIQDPSQYGAASVLGFEGDLAVDYLITPSVFARAAFRFETIGYSFTGNGTLSSARDGDPMTQDVTGARDSYIGGMATVGYLY
ncbi:MAG TPA: hypothetical protein VFK02_04130 [Kofleriaceae bacterium]|nr:hypothetical protein [Kofleriaceae bacterium]